MNKYLWKTPNAIRPSKVYFPSIDTTSNTHKLWASSPKNNRLFTTAPPPYIPIAHKGQSTARLNSLGCLTFFCDGTSVGFANVVHAGEWVLIGTPLKDVQRSRGGLRRRNYFGYEEHVYPFPFCLMNVVCGIIMLFVLFVWFLTRDSSVGRVLPKSF